jgi:pyruvate dehydrogenase E1 component
MTTAAPTRAALRALEDRVLWLATAIVDHANRVRPGDGQVKVGGHQASSASMTSIMTALWFDVLRADDRVSVKPHAAPVLHAVNYLLGELDEEYLTTLRSFGGLQSYPSRTKDPDPVDYSTGSVGIGATAPIWGALARRYLERGATDRPVGRQYSLLGDAELDEGACWEAIQDPLVAGLGEVVWVVDVNRQSLDRVVPYAAVDRYAGMFAAAGWQALRLKYGRLLEEMFRMPGGPALRDRLDLMTNEEYQRLLRCRADELRKRLPGDGPRRSDVARLLTAVEDERLHTAVRDLGGHDLAALLDAFAAIDDSRPTVLFAYTVKGHRLASEGHPQNHSRLLTEEQMRELATRLGADLDRPWQRPGPHTPEGDLCARAAARLRRTPPSVTSGATAVPTDLGGRPGGSGSTQQALGRTLVELTRRAPEVAGLVVTVSPDVASSTNLGGWINKVGVWAPHDRVDWFDDDGETILHWRERPSGQHIALGIAETNLAGLIAELGSTWSRWGRPLLPIGVLYDPFLNRTLEPWSFGIYAGGQSIMVGTPSGVTLAAEGGVHQSIVTPSIGLEQPGCTAYEPAFVLDAQWCLLDGLSRLGRPDGSSTYLRLSTRAVAQDLAGVPEDPAARERRRRQVVAGAYPLRRHDDPVATIAVMGAVVPEALAAADRLDRLDHGVDVVCVTSPDLLFRALQARSNRTRADGWILEQAFPAERARPLVTVLDGHPHTLAFLATINRVPTVNLGVTSFGQSGRLDEVYRYHGLDADSLVAAVLDVRRA